MEKNNVVEFLKEKTKDLAVNERYQTISQALVFFHQDPYFKGMYSHLSLVSRNDVVFPYMPESNDIKGYMNSTLKPSFVYFDLNNKYETTLTALSRDDWYEDDTPKIVYKFSFSDKENEYLNTLKDILLTKNLKKMAVRLKNTVDNDPDFVHFVDANMHSVVNVKVLFSFLFSPMTGIDFPKEEIEKIEDSKNYKNHLYMSTSDFFFYRDSLGLYGIENDFLSSWKNKGKKFEDFVKEQYQEFLKEVKTQKENGKEEDYGRACSDYSTILFGQRDKIKEVVSFEEFEKLITKAKSAPNFLETTLYKFSQKNHHKQLLKKAFTKRRVEYLKRLEKFKTETFVVGGDVKQKSKKLAEEAKKLFLPKNVDYKNLEVIKNVYDKDTSPRNKWGHHNNVQYNLKIKNSIMYDQYSMENSVAYAGLLNFADINTFEKNMHSFIYSNEFETVGGIQILQDPNSHIFNLHYLSIAKNHRKTELLKNMIEDAYEYVAQQNGILIVSMFSQDGKHSMRDALNNCSDKKGVLFIDVDDHASGTKGFHEMFLEKFTKFEKNFPQISQKVEITKELYEEAFKIFSEGKTNDNFYNNKKLIDFLTNFETHFEKKQSLIEKNSIEGGLRNAKELKIKTL